LILTVLVTEQEMTSEELLFLQTVGVSLCILLFAWRVEELTKLDSPLGGPISSEIHLLRQF
jgi:hypothetical protein